MASWWEDQYLGTCRVGSAANREVRTWALVVGSVGSFWGLWREALLAGSCWPFFSSSLPASGFAMRHVSSLKLFLCCLANVAEQNVRFVCNQALVTVGAIECRAGGSGSPGGVSDLSGEIQSWSVPAPERITGCLVSLQDSTRRMSNSPPQPATVTVGELATDPQAKCRSKEVLAVSNATASKRSCDACLLSLFYLT